MRLWSGITDCKTELCSRIDSVLSRKLYKRNRWQYWKNSRHYTMMAKRFEIWLADLNPRVGTEPGKIRPVLVVQTDLLNQLPHPSTLICPITTKVHASSKILRVHLGKGESNLSEESDVMIDQLRAIDNKRLIRKIGQLPPALSELVIQNIKIVLDLDDRTV